MRTITLGKEKTVKLKNIVFALLKDQSGQDLIEYALVAALIGLGAVSAMNNFARTISSAFSTIGSALTSNV